MARIEADNLTRLSIAALRAAGVDPADAAKSARILVEGELMGISTHGLIRLPIYCSRLKSGGMDATARIRVDRKAPSLALVDGANGLGPLVGATALEAALEMVADTGIAYVGCRNSNHYGAIAPYALQALEAGYLFVGGTSASPTMAPWGGREARIGNNPICFAAPCRGDLQFILDMAVSVAARGKIRAARDAGRPIPNTWSVDASGRPTTDPVEALKGLLSPMGTYKGSGLSMAVDILSGALSGAKILSDISGWDKAPDRAQGLGHFFLLLDPARLIGRDAFLDAMDRLKEIVRGTPPANADTPVLLPGQIEQERRAAALRDGISVPDALLAEIEALASG